MKCPALPELSLELCAPGGDARIFDDFLSHVARAPEALAIAHHSGTYTYRELEFASRRVALMLLANGARAEENTGTLRPVAIHGRRCPELVVAMLGCLRAGIPFAVLDAGYPTQRLVQLIELMRPGCALLLEPAAEDEARFASLVGAEHCHALRQRDFRDQNGNATGAGIDQVSPEQIAYLLFTSGTTGTPKGIKTSHHPLVHFVRWYAEQFAATPASRFSMLSGLGHDPVLRDIFVPLSVGASLHIPRPEATVTPAVLFDWLVAERITHAHVTPQLGQVICAGSRQRKLSDLRFVLSGGDVLHRHQALELCDVAPAARVVNFYGATETPQAMGFHVFDADEAGDAVPVGKGIRDVQLLVLDEHHQLRDVGKLGQVVVRTKFLSGGYLHDATLTERKFITNPCRDDADDRLYLTGDCGYFLEDGSVVVKGRLDDQVKIRGYRVEPSDVVRQLSELPGVTASVVLPERLASGENRLIAYLVGPAASSPAQQSAATPHIKAELAKRLPSYMVPSLYVWLTSLPLLPNGKLDRARLPAASAAVESAGDDTSLEPPSELEAALIQEWKVLLGLESIGTESSFVDLGGDSLSFIRASTSLEAKLGWLPEGWERLPIRQLAQQQRAGTRRVWTRVSMPVLMRAISIVAVVWGHLGGFDLTGTTHTLFVIAGISFATYQLPVILRTNRVDPILRTLFRIALPTIPWLLLLQLKYTTVNWPSLLLVSNYFAADYSGGITSWFVEVLVQCFLFLALLLSIPLVRSAVRSHSYRASVIATSLALAVAALAPFVWNTEHLLDRVLHLRIGLVLMGCALALADSARRKVVVLVLTLVAFLQAPLLRGSAIAWTPLVCVALLLWRKDIPLPAIVASVVNACAGASLFIYLMHAQIWHSVVQRTPWGENFLFAVVASIAGAVLFWRLWERAYSATARAVQRTVKGKSLVSPSATPAEG